MADDNVPIQPSVPSTTTPVTLIKTIRVVDSLNNTVEVQAVVLVDETGKIIGNLMTNDVGQQILNMLVNVYNVLAESTGIGLRMPAQSAIESSDK